MINSILVLGGGSAGLITALGLRAALPAGVTVTLVRSTRIGAIGVGEGTTVNVPFYLHNHLRMDRAEFFRAVDPSYKRGVRFKNWGPRPHYDYALGRNLSFQLRALPNPAGYYCDKEFTHISPAMSLMEHGRFFLRDAKGGVLDDGVYGYHFENERLVEHLESVAAARGIALIDDEFMSAQTGEGGISLLHFTSGRSMRADLYVDASGFRAELLGAALGEPLESFQSSLFCDSAVVGGWARAGEPVLPYTVAEAMDSGWCWQIEHRNRINRGYVYASSFVTDADAEAEFRRKNPKITQTRIVRFISGARRRSWVKNVVAIGNSCGFVEPLEATALGNICEQTAEIAQCLSDTGRDPRPSAIDAYNGLVWRRWCMIRWFLATHYKCNSRFDTPFWRAARADTDIGEAGPLLRFFEDNGPSMMATGLVPQPIENFGLDGYWIHLVGMKVPYRRTHAPSAAEMQTWNSHRAKMSAMGVNGFAFGEY